MTSPSARGGDALVVSGKLGLELPRALLAYDPDMIDKLNREINARHR